MTEKEEVKEFYRLVKNGREACAGSNVKSFKETISLIHKAMKYLSLSDNIPLNYMDTLAKAALLLTTAKVYSDRLKPDEELCTVCNTLRKRYSKWIC